MQGLLNMANRVEQTNQNPIFFSFMNLGEYGLVLPWEAQRLCNWLWGVFFEVFIYTLQLLRV